MADDDVKGRYRLLRGKHHAGGKVYREGDEVEMTEEQYLNLADRFEPVKKGQGTGAHVEVAGGTNPLQDPKEPKPQAPAADAADDQNSDPKRAEQAAKDAQAGANASNAAVVTDDKPTTSTTPAPNAKPTTLPGGAGASENSANKAKT